jgi:acetyl-CoA carboxylase carboxyltransferase component
MNPCNDQDRFEYEVQRSLEDEYQQIMQDPVVKAELALRDADIAIQRLREALEELARHSKPETGRRFYENSGNLPI